MDAVPPPAGDDDGSADTQMFRAFVERRDDPEPRRAVGVPFRLLTLAAGLLAFLAVAWLLLRG